MAINNKVDVEVAHGRWPNLLAELNLMGLNRLGTNLPAMSCEISEAEKAYLARFDMPGIQKENVKIEIDGNVLTVSAERREEIPSDDSKKHVSEIRYGSYSRSFTIPSAIDEEKIDAKFDNGVLTISLPKAEVSEPRKIAIH